MLRLPFSVGPPVEIAAWSLGVESSFFWERIFERLKRGNPVSCGVSIVHDGLSPLTIPDTEGGHLSLKKRPTRSFSARSLLRVDPAEYTRLLNITKD